MTEAQLQAACVKWLWNTHPQTRGLFFAVTNNSEHAVRGLQRKALGMVSGVSDCIFLWHQKAYLIEFKTETGKQSQAQKEWEQRVISEGFCYSVIRNEEEFINCILLII